MPFGWRTRLWYNITDNQRSGRKPILHFSFGRDRKAAAIAKSLGGNLKPGSSLLALVLTSIDHLNDPLHQRQIETMIGGYLLCRMGILDVIFQNGIEDLIRRQRIAVLLIGAKLGGWRLLQAGLRDYRALRIDVASQAIDQDLGNVGYHR